MMIKMEPLLINSHFQGGIVFILSFRVLKFGHGVTADAKRLFDGQFTFRVEQLQEAFNILDIANQSLHTINVDRSQSLEGFVKAACGLVMPHKFVNKPPKSGTSTQCVLLIFIPQNSELVHF
jgi:hypothetical protein